MQAAHQEGDHVQGQEAGAASLPPPEQQGEEEDRSFLLLPHQGTQEELKCLHLKSSHSYRETILQMKEEKEGESKCILRKQEAS